MRCMSFECDDDTPVGTLVYGSGSYAYIVVAGEHGPSLEAFGWRTNHDRNPLPGEYERVMKCAKCYTRQGLRRVAILSENNYPVGTAIEYSDDRTLLRWDPTAVVYFPNEYGRGFDEALGLLHQKGISAVEVRRREKG